MSQDLRQKLDGVQALRGLAAIAVIWHHALEHAQGMAYATEPPRWLILSGAAGVDIFFVISGFIMVYVSARRDIAHPGAAAEFLTNRIHRIYPLYWVVCAVTLAAMTAGFFYEKRLGAWDVLGSLLLVPTENPIIGIAWTLNYEMYFYVIFAVSLRLRTLRHAVLFASALIAIIMALAAGSSDHALAFADGGRSFLANPIVLEFAFGMAIGLAYVSGRLRAAWIGSPLVLLAALAMFGLSSFVFIGDTTHGLPAAVRVFAWGLPAALCMLWALNTAWRDSRVARIAVAAGDASYANYLFHIYFLLVFVKGYHLTDGYFGLSPWITVNLATLACAVAGWGIHRLLERPINQLLRRRAARRRAGSSMAS